MAKYDVNAPPPRDYAAEGRETIAGQLAVAPDVYAAEAEYGPMYAALDRDTFKESVRDLGPFIESDVDAAARATGAHGAARPAGGRYRGHRAIRGPGYEGSARGDSRTDAIARPDGGVESGLGALHGEQRRL